MAIPSIPTGIYISQGNGSVYLAWNLVSGATGYPITRSTDGVTYSALATATVNNYTDTTGTAGTLYYYKVASSNSDGTSSYASPLSIIPAKTGQISLKELRLHAQERADMVGSQFLSTPEWNYNINKSYQELYDLLITAYEDYYVAPRLTFTLDGTSNQYDLPNGSNYSGAPALYKLYGVDLGLDNSQNAFVTLKKFDFIQRNRYVFPQITATLLGVFNLRYRLLGGKIQFIPTPAGGQTIGLWYFPRLLTLLADTDIADGISGWEDYVAIDAAIKAKNKEETDVTSLMAEKGAMKLRIEQAAQNRDAGSPDTISDVRSRAESWGGYGGGWDGPIGGV